MHNDIILWRLATCPYVLLFMEANNILCPTFIVRWSTNAPSFFTRECSSKTGATGIVGRLQMIVSLCLLTPTLFTDITWKLYISHDELFSSSWVNMKYWSLIPLTFTGSGALVFSSFMYTTV